MRKLIGTRKTLSGVSERKDLRAGARSIPTLRCASEMRDFRDLKLWEKAHRLTLAVYKATLVFPKEGPCPNCCGKRERRILSVSQKPTGSWSESDRGGTRLWEKVYKDWRQWKDYLGRIG